MSKNTNTPENKLRSRASHWGYSLRISTTDSGQRHYKLFRKDVVVVAESGDLHELDEFIDREIIRNVKTLPERTKQVLYVAFNPFCPSVNRC